MSKPQHWLGALLAFQVLLTGGLYVHSRQAQAAQSQQSAVLAFDKASVDKLVLADKDHKVTLTKTAQGWQLPEYHNLPVDQTRLDALLTTLSELKGGWAVSTTADSHEQFEVAEKRFAHKVDLFAGDKPVAELYLGTSPGFRKTHVRNAKEPNVYAADINTMDVPVVNDQWFDQSLLKAKDLTEIKGKDFLLKKSGAEWKLDGKDTAKLNSANALLVAKSLSGLRVESLQAASPSGPPTLTLEVVDGGKPLTYQFWQSGESYTVKRSDNDNHFGMSKPIYEALASQNLAKLTEPVPAKAGEVPKAGATPVAGETPGGGATP
jgi:hypothetical protein